MIDGGEALELGRISSRAFVLRLLICDNVTSQPDSHPSQKDVPSSTPHSTNLDEYPIASEAVTENRTKARLDSSISRHKTVTFAPAADV